MIGEDNSPKDVLSIKKDRKSASSSVVEKVSDVETEQKLKDFVRNIWEDYISGRKVDLLEQIEILNQSPKKDDVLVFANDLANFVSQVFTFVDEGAGKHTIANILDEEISQKNKQDDILTKVKISLEETTDRSTFAEKTATLYKELNQLKAQAAKERDCKVPAVIFTYLLKLIAQKYNLPIQIRFATIRAMPHPFIAINFNDQPNEAIFFDFTPNAIRASVNNQRILRMLGLEEKHLGRITPVVRFHSSDLAGLQILDEYYLNYKKNNVSSKSRIIH